MFHNWGWGFMWFGWVFWIIFIGIIIWAVIRITSGQSAHKSSGNNEEALQILKRRYASGEISKEEYDKIKNDIIS